MKRLITIIVLAVSCVSAVHADDRPLFGLTGDVSRLTTESTDGDFEWATVVDFDSAGLIAAIDNVAPDITRDASGRLLTVTISDEDEDGETVNVVSTLTYTPDGLRVASYRQENPDETVVFTHTYDPVTGHTLTTVIASEGYEDEAVSVTFTYTASDRRGNWTERSDDTGIVQRRIIEYR